jgi:hypothetical protein
MVARLTGPGGASHEGQSRASFATYAGHGL